MSKYTIAKYIRLSIEDIKYDSLSISNQHLLLDRHIDSLDLEDAEILEFVDNGYSGVNFERPAVQELLDLVRQSKIDCIIVKDFSRFGRNSIETGYFIEMVFPLFRTRFISVSDDFDSADYKEDTGGMEVAFKFLMHEYYSQDMSRKEKAAKYAKMKRGEYISERCIYGYRKGANGRLEINEDVAPVVWMIFEIASTMKSTGDILKALHEKKIPTPGEYYKSKGKDYHDVSRSMGIWQRSTVIRILENESYTGTYIMGRRAVVCRYTKVNETAECHRLEIDEENIEILLFKTIRKQAQVILGVDRFGDTSEMTIKAEQQAELDKRINALNEDKCGLYERFILGELDAEAYKSKKAAIDAELNHLNRSLGVLKAETAELSAKKASAEELRKLADTALGAKKLNRQLVDLLVERIYVFPNNHVEIVWKVVDFGAITVK
jgi:DNA invertase Pin-like site-specific DNA recombinase